MKEIEPILMIFSMIVIIYLSSTINDFKMAVLLNIIIIGLILYKSNDNCIDSFITSYFEHINKFTAQDDIC